MAFNVIDVSKWQGTIDWFKVSKRIDGVILRIGYRGYADGSIVIDPMFYSYYEGCKKNRINYGVYFFTQAKNYAEGKAEAEWTIRQLKSLDYKPTYPIYIDSENSSGYPKGRADNISSTARTEALKGFCETMEDAGYFAGIYASTSWLQGSGAKVIDTALIRFSHWIADYRTTANGKHYCGYNGSYGMWQYTSQGYIAGISGKVDMNYDYINFPEVIKRNGLNGFEAEGEAEPVTEPVDARSDPIDIVIEKPTESHTEPLQSLSDDSIHDLLLAILKYLIRLLGGSK